MEGYIGEVKLFAGNFAPRNWSFCQGQLLAISSNNALFSIIGTVYGGDGRSTFALPDLRGRVPVGPGTGSGLNPVQIGQKGGVENVTLNVTEIPSHSHTAQGTANLPVEMKTNSTDGTTAAPGNNYLAKSVYEESRGNFTDILTYSPSEDGTLLKGGTASGTVQVQVGNTGGNQSHTNMQPFLGVHYVICLQGIYPSRN